VKNELEQDKLDQRAVRRLSQWSRDDVIVSGREGKWGDIGVF
jgi:hypothetical protein